MFAKDMGFRNFLCLLTYFSLFTSCSTQKYFYKSIEEGDFQQKGKGGVSYFLDKKEKKSFIRVEALGIKQLRSDSNEKAIVVRVTLEHFGTEPILIDPKQQLIQVHKGAEKISITSESPESDQTPIKVSPNYTRIVDLIFKPHLTDHFDDSLNLLTVSITLQKGAKKIQKSLEFKRTPVEKGINTFHSRSEPDKATTHYGRRSDNFYIY